MFAYGTLYMCLWSMGMCVKRHGSAQGNKTASFPRTICACESLDTPMCVCEG